MEYHLDVNTEYKRWVYVSKRGGDDMTIENIHR